jgi:hypothetical protein
MIMNLEPLRGHVWTFIENNVFQYHETIVPSTQDQENENLHSKG